MTQAGLAARFQPFSSYTRPPDGSYHFLPFRFARFDDRFFVSNEAGEYLLLDSPTFAAFANKRLPYDSPPYRTLKAKHFLLDDDSSVPIDLLALKVRTRNLPLRQFTGLHLFVVTLRCDYSCHYCQVSRQTEDRSKFDMSEADAATALDFVFKSPSPTIKIEFQGGEPLLNFALIRYVVERAKEINKAAQKQLQFVIASNLSMLNNEILDFCEKHDIYFSTSLDGPEDLHNKNRARPGRNGYRLTTQGIQRVKERLGPERIGALMTTTQASLDRVREIIDEYVSQGFRSIFLRPLSPYGFAVKTAAIDKYNTGKWLEFYKEGLTYILELNRSGVPLIEQYASIILAKLLTPFGTTYVDLQSPAGFGISALVYNYDGDVYASDESRMLAEMGDKTFRLGNVRTSTYEDIFTSGTLLNCLEETITESVPMCCDCAYAPYCGSDPVYHQVTQGDWVGHKAKSGFCEKNMQIIKHLVRLLEDDAAARDVLMSWIKV